MIGRFFRLRAPTGDSMSAGVTGALKGLARRTSGNTGLLARLTPTAGIR